MKRFLSIITASSLLFALTLPVSVYAHGKGPGLLNRQAKIEFKEKRKELKEKHRGFFGIRSLVAFVATVDDKNKVVIASNGDNTYKILADGALIVKMTEDGARMGSLADLTVGARAHFWISKERGQDGDYKAFLIAQALFQKEEPAPNEPRIQFSSWGSSGAEGSSTVSIPVELSKAASQDVKVHYAISGTATGSSTDYVLVDGDLMIPAGQTSGHIDFTVMNDTMAEGPETVILTLSNPVNASLGKKTQYTYTITDGD